MELFNNPNNEEGVPPIRYPIKYNHAGSLHRLYLRDVDNNVVRDDYGKQLNLYSKDIVDYIACGRIRFIYDIKKEYRYIITSDHQYRRFQYERVFGSTNVNDYYSVYYDSDATPVQFYRYNWRHCNQRPNRRGITKTIPL